MNTEITVGIKYCGGCRLQYDRNSARKSILEALEGKAVFESAQTGKTYDYILMLSGCLIKCADVRGLCSRNGIVCVCSMEDTIYAIALLRRS